MGLPARWVFCFVCPARSINLAVLLLQAIVEQLAFVLEQARARMPLGQKAGWVVMAS